MTLTLWEKRYHVLGQSTLLRPCGLIRHCWSAKMLLSAVTLGHVHTVLYSNFSFFPVYPPQSNQSYKLVYKTVNFVYCKECVTHSLIHLTLILYCCWVQWNSSWFAALWMRERSAVGDHGCLSNTWTILECCVKIALTKLPVCLCRTTIQDSRERKQFLWYVVNNSRGGWGLVGFPLWIIWFAFLFGLFCFVFCRCFGFLFRGIIFMTFGVVASQNPALLLVEEK